MANSICIVASTLPIAFMERHAKALGVETIVTTSDTLSRSYGHLVSKVGGGIGIRRAPPGLLSQSIYFAFVVLSCRISGRQLIFFHECCLPVLDLLIHFFRPPGKHFPQVSMLGSIPMAFTEAPRSRLFSLLRLFGLGRHFTLYYSPSVGSNLGEYSLSIKSYPPTIEQHNASFGGKVSHFADGPRQRSVLILTGKAMSSDEEQIAIFSAITRLALSYGLRCDVKDHPNPHFRLGFEWNDTTVIDPEMPSELLDDNYGVVLGTSSTGLLQHGDRAFSILEMLKSLSADQVALVQRHFDMSAPGHELRYLQDLQEIEAVFRGMNE